jgi:hypothetical protein
MSILACDDDEFAPLLEIGNALFLEMLILARHVGDRARGAKDDRFGDIKARESYPYRTFTRYLLGRDHAAAGYTSVLLEQEIGLRFSGLPFPYVFPTFANAHPGFPLGGTIPADPAPPPGAVTYAMSRHWLRLHEQAGQEQAGQEQGGQEQGGQTKSSLNAFGAVVRGCMHVGSRHGFEAAVRYIGDLVASGQVLFPATAAYAASRVLRAAAAVGDDLDVFTDVLGPIPDTVRAAIEQEADLATRDDPPVRDSARVSAAISDLVAAAWVRIRQLQDATDAGDWIFALAGLEAYLMFVDDTVRLTVDQVSPVMQSVLRQLEEVAADCPVAWVALELGDFRTFIEHQHNVRSAMIRKAADQERGESRFRRERLMVPPLILENGLTADWARPGPACGRLIASFHDTGLAQTASPFRAGDGPKTYPWSTGTLALHPASPELWHHLSQACRREGRHRAAEAAGRIADAFG